jgi:putative DNA primase/helicase
LLDLPVTDEPITIVLSDGANRLLFEFSQAVELDLRDGGRFERIKDWAGKLPGAAVRIAGNLDRAARVFDNTGLADRIISAETMEKALDIFAVLSSHALAVFDLMGADDSLRAARKVWKWINRNEKSRFTFRDAFQALRGSYSRALELDPAFRALEERFYLRELPGVDHTPGRPRRVYEVNPALSGSWGTA